ncbi:tyrosine-protein phosphatase [Ligilactobacillus salivarius]|uniref:Protein-tyrosine-phosphatase n=1 Tax=Ligilactobacillus salivarius TaxID=1624 RepID=A0A1D7TR50_9LACO|nr:tyrosine-protein phosphatase [Ligilactobacillus salivarius]AOO73409.1 protein-tyrosine-phosphatase [Ligilactobacillus salivarius]MBC6926862.1 protein-tyrosine-phosphatase [Ligilactobacillus salivarius]UDE97018.1 tyrosine-protein phosphatase [Ligilactobacillus salivarius]UUV96140.1 tyrosine-protein phosphatase [Ligilactobacillus salivarius]
MEHRMLELEEGINFRELGGYLTEDGRKIKWHKLLRCGSMAQLTKNDVDYLDQYGVRYIIDLRSPEESNYSPDKYPDKAQYFQDTVYPFSFSLFKNLGIINNMRLGASNMDFGRQTYLQMLLDPHAQAAYRKMFNVLLENDKEGKSVVFHCTAGKDRTGVAAFLILSALGVSEKQIVEDYLYTNLFFDNYSSETINDALESESQTEIAQRLNSKTAVIAETIKVLPKACRVVSGSVEKFLEEKLGMTKAKIERLQELYLE